MYTGSREATKFLKKFVSHQLLPEEGMNAAYGTPPRGSMEPKGIDN
jgi:hypothetical protein